MMANIYVNDILGAAESQRYMLKLLAAIIEAIFLVCETPNVTECQCPLSLEKGLKLIVGQRPITLGLVDNTTKMTVGVADEYIYRCLDLFNL